MFELYSENARRTIVDAKHEAHKLGHRKIQTEHLLLALLKDSNLFGHTLNGLFAENLRAEILTHLPKGEELPRSIDLPLADDLKKALDVAAEECNAVSNKHIENAHLLLGVLRTEGSYASQLLTRRSVPTEALRAFIATLDRREPGATKPKAPLSPEQQFMVETIHRWGDLNRQGKRREALKFIDGLIDVPNRHPTIKRELLRIASNTALSLRDFETVRKYNERILAEDPNDALALYALADCAGQQGKSEQSQEYASKCYEKALALDEPLRKGIIELLETRFPGIGPSTS